MRGKTAESDERIGEAKMREREHIIVPESQGSESIADLVRRMLADLGEAGIRPELAIIGEPTLMRVVGAHKAGAVLHTRCCGREGHSSAPDKGANAVMMAGEFIAYLAALGEQLKSDRDPRFDPPYTTLQANKIAGGTAGNVLAREAMVTWEYRALPDRETTSLLKRIKA